MQIQPAKFIRLLILSLLGLCQLVLAESKVYQEEVRILRRMSVDEAEQLAVTRIKERAILESGGLVKSESILEDNVLRESIVSINAGSVTIQEVSSKVTQDGPDMLLVYQASAEVNEQSIREAIEALTSRKELMSQLQDLANQNAKLRATIQQGVSANDPDLSATLAALQGRSEEIRSQYVRYIDLDPADFEMADKVLNEKADYYAHQIIKDIKPGFIATNIKIQGQRNYWENGEPFVEGQLEWTHQWANGMASLLKSPVAMKEMLRYTDQYSASITLQRKPCYGAHWLAGALRDVLRSSQVRFIPTMAECLNQNVRANWSYSTRSGVFIDPDFLWKLPPQIIEALDKSSTEIVLESGTQRQVFKIATRNQFAFWGSTPLKMRLDQDRNGNPMPLSISVN